MTAPSPAASSALVPATRTGVLLVNLGTPDSPETGDVRRYLREFLSDPRVVDIHPVGRWLLLNLIILPFRPAKSGHAYKTIWTEAGSPLLTHGRDLTAAVQAALGDRFVVALGMRYGNPSIPAALAQLMAADVTRLVVVPLFPQYSSAATGSALDRVYQEVGHGWNVPAVASVAPFYDDPGFIDAFAQVARPKLEGFQPDYVLFSYHGVPERQVEKSDPTGQHCLRKPDCCARIEHANRYCYRAQCYATTRALAAALGLAPDGHDVSFQSRLGRTPWIKPYTDEVLPALRAQGKRRVAVLCPAFVADCLETLEEIGIRAREDWLKAGGEDLLLVPSLNAHPAWVDAVAALVRAA
jgi:ferrochelatase